MRVHVVNPNTTASMTAKIAPAARAAAAGGTDNLARYGLAGRCVRVRAAEVPVLDLENPGSSARAAIEREIALAVAEDRADAIVLGCAGMVDLATDLSAKFGVPVIEGVAAAVKPIEALA